MVTYRKCSEACENMLLTGRLLYPMRSLRSFKTHLFRLLILIFIKRGFCQITL